ncbi:MAG: response regulator [Phycisphaerae bacterium]|jgi:DNA-binding response OmpR family regulator|nr:response regulator [Phycisphaerae bacterium]
MAAPYDGKSILVVDDDPDILTAIVELFKESGAEITTASDGNTAVNLAMSKKPDLLILDAMLPRRSGFLVLEKLKARKPPGTKPFVIMITGNQGKRYQECAETFGAEDFINKPFRMDRLRQSVEDLLAKA